MPKNTTNIPCKTSSKEFLWRYLVAHPFHHSLWRTFEAKELFKLEFRRPALDLGCSEGFFTSRFFKEPVCNGIDLSKKRVAIAKKSNVHQTLTVGNASMMPYKEGIFNTVFSVSVIEHIPEIKPVLEEVARVLSPSGRFFIVVPSHLFADSLFFSFFFRKLGFTKLSRLYGKLVNRHLKHHHCYSPRTWEALLNAAGMHLILYKFLVPYKALHFIERNYFLSYLQYLSIFLSPDRVPLKEKIGSLLHNIEGIPNIFVHKKRQSSPIYQKVLKQLEMESDYGAGLLIVAEKPNT